MCQTFVSFCFFLVPSFPESYNLHDAHSYSLSATETGTGSPYSFKTVVVSWKWNMQIKDGDLPGFNGDGLFLAQVNRPEPELLSSLILVLLWVKRFLFLVSIKLFFRFFFQFSQYTRQLSSTV